ncbi:MAG: prepilin peptidase [Firmicutes bacterium]|nr:prepilin peptidase [Bacillota bacterium]
MIDTAAKFPELCLGCSPALNRELFPAQSAAFPLALSAAFPIALRALPASWFRDLDEPDRLQGRPFDPAPGICALLFALCAALCLQFRPAALQTAAHPFSALRAAAFPSPALSPAALPILLAAAAGDAKYRVISDQLLALLCFLALPGALLSEEPLIRAILSLSFPLLWLACALAAELFGGEISVGFGDAKLLFACSLLAGPGKALASLVPASLACGAFAAALLASGRASKKDPIALGPFLVFGIILVCAE